MAFQIWSDRDKWSNEWFMDLSPDHKLAFLYIWDTCDQAGAWDINIKLLNFTAGINVDKNELITAFGDKILMLSDNKLWIKDFCKIQYPELLTTTSNKVKTVKRLLREYDLNKYFPSSLTSLELPRPDKTRPTLVFNKSNIHAKVDELYKKYPKKEGKMDGMFKLAALLKTDEDLEKFESCFNKYMEKLRAEKTKPEFIKMWSTFCNQYLDFEDWAPTQTPQQEEIWYS